MNVIFTCGGTGGHINPAIAVANILKERHPDCNILFIGVKDEMEEQLVPRAGYALRTVPGGGFSRRLTWKGIKWNVMTAGRILTALKQCRKIIREFKPDVICGTGGYGSFPALYMGSRMGIPTCVHESNAMPGMTTRMIADRVDRMLICFPESARHYRSPEKVEAVGMPVRREFIYTRKEAARAQLGLGAKPVVVSAFGSQGARDMNLVMKDLFALEQQENFPFHHIHATGSLGWEWMPEKVREKGVELEKCPDIDMREYIFDMPMVMAAADVIIGRAGSSTCNEIAASGTPCVLIPSPNVTDNHQEKNARVLADRGGAVLMLEKDCTAQALFETLKQLLADRDRQQAMASTLLSMAVPDSAERICSILEELAGKKK